MPHAFRRLMRRLGIQNASHRTLRHTGASAMLAAGISVRVVQEIGGWTSLRMLERYTHPTDAEKLRAVETASRLTRVGTKTGTAAPRCGRLRRREPHKLLTDSKLECRPQGEFYPLPCVDRSSRRWPSRHVHRVLTRVLSASYGCLAHINQFCAEGGRNQPHVSTRHTHSLHLRFSRGLEQLRPPTARLPLRMDTLTAWP